MSCSHDGYDDYFERCHDCGMTGEQLHAAQCDIPLVFSDEDCCWRCYRCDAWLDDVEAAS